MSEYSFTYHDHGFSLDNVHNATLFLKLGKAGLSFIIAAQGRLLAWKDACPLTAIMEDAGFADILAAPFKEVRIGLLPEALTLIPAELFANEKVGEYARYLDVKAGHKVFSTKMDGNNHLIYKANVLALDALSAKININSITIPADRGWLTAIAKTEPGDDTLYVDVNEGQLSLLNFNGQKLRFYNSFDAQGIDDVLYYSLYAASQLNVKPDSAALIVSGNCTNADIDKLNQFFRVSKFNDIQTVQTPATVQQHQILSLAALA